MEEKKLILSEETQRLSLNVETKSTDCLEFDEIATVLIDITPKTVAKLIRANQMAVENDFAAVMVMCNDDVLHVKEDGSDHNTDYYPSYEHFVVNGYRIYFRSENKYNSDCFLETESFVIEEPAKKEKRMYHIHFEAAESTAYSTTVDADSPEEAARKLYDDPGEYDWNTDESIETNIDQSSIVVIGELVPDKDVENCFTVKKFDKPYHFIP